MESFISGRYELPPDPDDPDVVEILARWDELPSERLAEIERSAAHGPRLALLREADTWLDRAVGSIGECPDTNELYDFGRGPGYTPLEPVQRKRIEAHLAECSECESFVETLESSPPLPLATAPVDEEAEVAPAATHAPTPLLRWAPLAAAAAVLALATTYFGSSEIQGKGRAFPEPPLLRGESQGTLLFPRGPVLAPAQDVPGFAAAPRFEIASVEGAQRYRVVVRQHDGGAFSTGATIVEFEGTAPTLAAAIVLAPGFYTWEAWANTDGLERELGQRDFHVVEEHEINKALAGKPDIDGVWLLHGEGFLTDARSLARALPASAEREAYLAAVPGR